MPERIFKIRNELKNENKALGNIDSITVDDITFEVLNSYESLLKKKDDMIYEMKPYRERELDAFTIGDSVSDGICVVNGSGTVIAINKGYTEITGIKPEEIIGHNINILLEKGYFTSAVSMKVIEQKEKVTALSTIAKNKKKVLITGNPFFNEKGEVTTVLTVMRDLTELIKLKEDLEKAEKDSEKYLNELNYLRNMQLERSGLIGESLEMKRLRELIDNVSKTDATILIYGETGSGKEVVAKELHERSTRKNMPYIKVNCAAIPDTLLESELFGYEKGAFTGAQSRGKPGMFEMANKGTILLDEISEMPLNLQTKLLRVLQEREIMRVGGTKSISLDVRVITSTNQDLFQLVQKGRFREDLYYRLNVVPIKIPPLRERIEDIALLAYNFLSKFNLKYGRGKSFDNTAIQALESYSWPGNVRELENVIERLVVVDEDEHITFNKIIGIIGRNKIPMDIARKAPTLRQAVEILERELIEASLKKHGSTHKAAKALGVTQPTISRKSKALGIKLGYI